MPQTLEEKRGGCVAALGRQGHFGEHLLGGYDVLVEPQHFGLDAQRQALDYGAKVSGATVHIVTATLDNGPIVLQASVPVVEGDTVESLSDRILVQEHRIYPEAIKLVLGGGWKVDGRRFGAELP